jgi:TfoX/Sxy family transcriptional regulator of competence genes
MAYDQDLANRLRECLQGEAGVTEKRMFGGLAFLVDGNLAVSASGKGGLLLRVDPEVAESLLAESRVERAVMGGRVMAGWLRVAPDVVRTSRQLARWVRVGVSYARTLAPK